MKLPTKTIDRVRLAVGCLMAFSGIILMLVAVIMSFEVLWIPISGLILFVIGLMLAGPKRFIEFLLSLPPV